MKRRIISMLLCSFVFSSFFSNIACASSMDKDTSDKMSAISLLSDKISDKNMNEDLVNNVEGDLDNLMELGFDVNSISVNDIKDDNEVEYVIQYNDKMNEYLIIKEDSEENLTLDVTSEGKHDILQINSDGRVYLDGREVIFSQEEYIEYNNDQSTNEITPYATARTYHNFYKSPQVGSSVNYATYISSHTNNDISVGKAIASCTASVIGTLIAYRLELWIGYQIGVAIFSSLAPGLIESASVSAPSSAHLSYKVTKYQYVYDYKYTDSKHYEYSGKYYVEKNLGGTYTTHKYYETVSTLYY